MVQGDQTTIMVEIVKIRSKDIIFTDVYGDFSKSALAKLSMAFGEFLEYYSLKLERFSYISQRKTQIPIVFGDRI